jgi:hypothetical protein
MPPKRPDLFAAKIRRRPTPGDNSAIARSATEPGAQDLGTTGSSLAWRVAFDQPGPSETTRAASATGTVTTAGAMSRTEATMTASPVPEATWRTRESTGPARRLVLFLGLAYLLLTALATGVVWTGYAVPGHRREPDDTTPPAPQREPGEPTPPHRELESTAPGLHTRPDRSRYLIMPLPAEVADRLRGTGRAFALGSVQ